jgi:hypothetical protein
VAAHTYRPCPHCGSSEIFRSKAISAGGGHAPNLLPGLGKWYAAAKINLVICRGCGLMRMFAEQEALDKLTDTDDWTPV